MPDQGSGANLHDSNQKPENKKAGVENNANGKNPEKQERLKQGSKDQKDYANKMWHHIQGSVSEKKREFLKGEVKKDEGRRESRNGNQQRSPDRRNRNSRPWQTPRGGQGNKRPDARPENRGEAKFVIKTEVKHDVKISEPKKEIKKVVELVNPFATTQKGPINPFTPIQSVEQPKQEVVKSAEPVKPVESVEPIKKPESKPEPIKLDEPIKKPAEPIKKPVEQPKPEPVKPEVPKPSYENVQPINPFAQSPSVSQSMSSSMPQSTPKPPMSPFSSVSVPKQNPVPVNNIRSEEVAKPPIPPSVQQNPFLKKEELKEQEFVQSDVKKEEPKKQPINPFANFQAAPKQEVKNPFAADPKTAVQQAEVVQEKAYKKELVDKGDLVKEDTSQSKDKTDQIFAPVKQKTADAEVKVVEVKKEDLGHSGRELGGHVETPVVEVKNDKAKEVEVFKSELWDILEQAGITKGTLIAAAVIILTIVIGVFMYVFGWYKPIYGLFHKKIVTPGQEQTQDKNAQTEPAVSIPAKPVELVESAHGVITAYIMGLEFNGGKGPADALPMGTWGSVAGVYAGDYFGKVGDERKDKFVEYVDLIRQLQNIYDTDIYTLLNKSTDRRAALTQHLTDLKNLIDRANLAYNDIQALLAKYEADYNSLLLQKTNAQSAFFTALYAYYGEIAYYNLGVFTKIYQDSIESRSYYNAYKALSDLYVAYVNALNPRYQDIYINFDALVKGVKVYLIPKSDIKTVIQLGQ